MLNIYKKIFLALFELLWDEKFTKAVNTSLVGTYLIAADNGSPIVSFLTDSYVRLFLKQMHFC